MSPVDLWSAKAKLRRAEKQCEELETYVNVFRDDPSSRSVLGADLDPDTGYHILRINHVPDYRHAIEDVSLSVGDIINNLRCSLDHLAWQYACAHAQGTPRKPKSVSFLPCNGDSGQHKAPGIFAPAAWGRMHEFQPCRGGNGRPDSWNGPYVHQLDLLTDLSNADKHHMLAHIELHANQFETIPIRDDLPPWVMETNTGMEFLPERVNDPDPGAALLDFSHASHLVELGAEVVRIRVPLWSTFPAIEQVGTATPLFTLPEGRPVVATLQRLFQYVEAVIADLEQNCP
ncbi:hypothetical protein ABZ341_38350 [Streptomyces sp. NPDC006173]|uniref:hypothetical protein n=1 Tax=Streptomyces sp. NPDC006173 TaxID=3155349 RepID=UPI0033D0907A